MKPQASEKSAKRKLRRIASRPSTIAQPGKLASPARACRIQLFDHGPISFVLDAVGRAASAALHAAHRPGGLDDILEMAEQAFAAIPGGTCATSSVAQRHRGGGHAG